MIYIQKYNLFEGKGKAKSEKRIRKFFNDDYIIKKAIDLNTKLSVWIINSYKQWLEKNLNTEWLEKNNVTINEIKDFMKNGKSENIKVKEYVDSNWSNFSPKIQYVLDWVNSFDYKNLKPEERNITKLTFDEAYKKSDKWHNSLKAGGVIEEEHGEVLMTFDDGFYWIDLETSYDRDEADAMGHCGNTDKGDTLYSLRDRKKSPHITSAIDKENGIVYQMKGRNNKKPISKYHLYIVALLSNDDLEYPLKGFGIEYDKDNDFNPSEDLTPELLSKLKEKRPNIDAPVHTPEDIKSMFDDMIESYYMQDNEYQFRLIDWLYNETDLKTIIGCMKTGDDLFKILCKEYPEKVKDYGGRFGDNGNDEEIKSVVMLDIASKYINADNIANKYNISLSNPKDSPSNKWNEIYKYIGYEELESILKNDYIVWSKYEDELEEKYPINKSFEDDFVSYPYYYDTKLKKYDIEDILDYFIGGDDKNIMNKLSDLFDYNWKKNWEKNKKENYWRDIDQVFDIYEVASELENKLTIKQMEEELEINDWYAYTDY